MMLLVALFKNKRTAAKILSNKLDLVVLLHICLHITTGTAELNCHQCAGISCLRTSYEGAQKCHNDFDICVNVFDGQTLLAQGCWEQLPEEFRNKCKSDVKIGNFNKLNGCFKCNENLCNKMSSSSFECTQCDSESYTECRTNPLSLKPTRCGVSRSPNQYCFVKRDGERVVRGCAYNVQEQVSCLRSDNCMICQPSELSACNNIALETNLNGTDVVHSEDEQPEKDLEQGEGRVCQECSGINCLRTSYTATQTCLNNIDVCVTVFEDQTVVAQGCWEQLSEEVRRKCTDGSQCLKCNENECNSFASASFECLQCDSNNDENCRTNPFGLVPSRCNISRTPNEYCYVKQDGDHVIRGCSYTMEEQVSCLSRDNCMICLPSEIYACNNLDVVRDDNSGSGEGSDNGSNEHTSGNDGSDNGSDGCGDCNSDGGNTEKTPSDDEDNTSSSDSSTEGLNNNDNNGGSSSSGMEESDNGVNGCTSISCLSCFVLVNIVLVFLVKQHITYSNTQLCIYA